MLLEGFLEMEFAIGLIIGLVLGIVFAVIMIAVNKKAAAAERQAAELQMREAFTAMAAQALDANSKQLTERAESTLDGKKQQIDQSVVAINERLSKLGEYFNQVENERRTEYGKLSSSVGSLATSTGELHKMLASTQRRGAWGERMADDILRLAGMSEGVNYRKQSSADAESGRPDFTFMLPNDLVVNMDVKFPLENYKAYLDAEDDTARTASSQQLVRDVKGHVGAISKRGYIDIKGGTVPYVLMFIPSEQIFSLVMETQPDLIDEALAKKIVLASPMTLYAMLAVIRQAAENANIMKTADEVISLLGAFNKQWQSYKEEFDKIGDRIDQLSAQYSKVQNTRTNMLQRPLDKIEDLRQQRGLPESTEE